MKIHKFTPLFLLTLLGFIILSGCEYNAPTVWPPQKQGAPDPLISSIEPDSAYGGITEIRIVGKNFSPVSGEDFVYFGTVPGLVQAASETQLTVIRPVNVGGSLTIQLAVRDAFETAKYKSYKLEQGIIEVGHKLGRVYSIAMDSDENLYAHLRSDKIIYKITPDGTQSEYGTFTEADLSSAMRMGPDGYLYLQRSTGTGKGYKRLYRIAPGGGEAERFVKLSRAVRSFDFDQNGDIFSGGKESGVFVIHSDKTFAEVGNYRDFDIKAVRVFDGYVYVAGKYNGTDTLYSPDSTTVIAAPDEKGIWKSQILTDGDLDTVEPVFDWANSGSFSASEINDVTFSVDGDMYVGTDNTNPILIIHSDGTTETLYNGLLNGPALHLVWGNGDYLYINRYGKDDDASGVDRVIMGKKGAVYYGRQ